MYIAFIIFLKRVWCEVPTACFCCAFSHLLIIEDTGRNASINSSLVYLSISFSCVINDFEMYKAFILFLRSVCWEVPSINLGCVFSHLLIVEETISRVSSNSFFVYVIILFHPAKLTHRLDLQFTSYLLFPFINIHNCILLST